MSFNRDSTVFGPSSNNNYNNNLISSGESFIRMKLLFKMLADQYVRTYIIYKQTQTTQNNENQLVQISLLAVIFWLVVC